jgi:hypothetical protein
MNERYISMIVLVKGGAGRPFGDTEPNCTGPIQIFIDFLFKAPRHIAATAFLLHLP